MANINNIMMTGAGGLLLFAMMFVVELAGSTELEGNVPQEVGQLLGTLEKSDCQFNRNDTWYDGQQAAAHLLKKCEYLLKRGFVLTTESFLERAASRSSVSGKTYLVRCGGGDAVESRKWFEEELQKLRKEQP